MRSRTAIVLHDPSEICGNPRSISFVNLAGSSPPEAEGPVILVAEDHRDSRDALRTLLEASGYQVHLAVDGAEAVEQAHALRPDLILMDIMMPELDGFEATRELRRHMQTSNTPIIAVTAMEGAQQLAIQAGANDFVRKPVDIRGLVAKVNDWLRPAPA
jgi:two-component system, cell cycle response regulator DivK